MKQLFIFMLLLVGISGMYAANPEDEIQPISSQNITDLPVFIDCDTILDINGYAVHLINEEGNRKFAGLNLFSDEMKVAYDKDLLQRMESELYKMSVSGIDPGESAVILISGRISDFKNINPETHCKIGVFNNKELTAAWSLNGRNVKVRMPISYSLAKAGSRSEIENRFISRLKEKTHQKRNFTSVKGAELYPYQEDKYILPGESYLKKDIITRNVYFNNDGATPVWDKENALESLSNLFIFPSDIYGEIQVELTVLKHEYGKKEVLTIPLRTLLETCEQDGCTIYWGVEKLADNKLEGAIFCLNKTQAYNHVVRVECDINELFDGTGVIKSRASLYIPTNNVDNTFQPEINATENHRPKYEIHL